jgi:hypothetical protein
LNSGATTAAKTYWQMCATALWKPKKMNQKVIAIKEELVGNGSIRVLGGATELEI